MNYEELANRFKFHPATTERRQVAHESIRTSCGHLAQWMNDHLPEGREKSLVMTHLEEVMFWANAAVARQPEE